MRNRIKEIYIKKIDVEQSGFQIPKVEYDIYSKLNDSYLIKLNKLVCSNIKINISIPIIITESLDILNSSSGYYNDICYPAKSDSGTDISLKDRKDNYINKNKNLFYRIIFSRYYTNYLLRVYILIYSKCSN